jgi:hypothetical protein
MVIGTVHTCFADVPNIWKGIISCCCKMYRIIIRFYQSCLSMSLTLCAIYVFTEKGRRLANTVQSLSGSGRYLSPLSSVWVHGGSLVSFYLSFQSHYCCHPPPPLSSSSSGSQPLSDGVVLSVCLQYLLSAHCSGQHKLTLVNNIGGGGARVTTGY